MFIALEPTLADVAPSFGAIKRAKLERVDEPTITYEAFVEDLDRGDSFTTSLIEVLVKVCVALGCCSCSGPTTPHRRLQNVAIAAMLPIVVLLAIVPHGPSANSPTPHPSTVNAAPVAHSVSDGA